MAKPAFTPDRQTADKKVGRYEAYRADGTMFYHEEDFVIGKSRVPAGVAYAMTAMQIFDKGEVIAKWNPKKLVLPKKPSKK